MSYVRLAKGSLGLMAQLITALTVKLLAATEELRAYPTADTTDGVAESAKELADTLRRPGFTSCCLLDNIQSGLTWASTGYPICSQNGLVEFT